MKRPSSRFRPWHFWGFGVYWHFCTWSHANPACLLDIDTLEHLEYWKGTQKPDECDMHTPKKSVQVTICWSKKNKDYIRRYRWINNGYEFPHRRPAWSFHKGGPLRFNNTWSFFKINPSSFYKYTYIYICNPYTYIYILYINICDDIWDIWDS